MNSHKDFLQLMQEPNSFISTSLFFPILLRKKDLDNYEVRRLLFI